MSSLESTSASRVPRSIHPSYHCLRAPFLSRGEVWAQLPLSLSGVPTSHLGRFHVHSFLSVLFPHLKDPDAWTHLMPTAPFALLLSFQTCPLHLPKWGTVVKPNVQPHCVILAACLNVGALKRAAWRRKWVQVLLPQPPWGRPADGTF